jgi:hypothetical protein
MIAASEPSLRPSLGDAAKDWARAPDGTRAHHPTHVSFLNQQLIAPAGQMIVVVPVGAGITTVELGCA